MSHTIRFSLLIDAGNTRIKWAIFQAGALRLPMPWLATGSLAHEEIDTLAKQVRDFIDDSHDELTIDEVLISNVAGDQVQASLERILHAEFPQALLRRFRSSAICAGLHNHYAKPEQLGSDRFASALAAHHFFPDTPLVVATCGTATTIDAIVPGRGFIGGMIAPGLRTMALSLAKNTAQLPDLTAQAGQLSLPELFANNTQQAIWSGCIHAQLGALQCAMSELQKQTGSRVELIISGGAVAYLQPYFAEQLVPTLGSEMALHHVENLVLTGLAVAAQAAQLAPEV
ncbi:MAG: type III pantothenate kinase [Burkholderiaceae bacterium]|nr:MAG: type III pantothenate kinase [Burkholderiaceae bacterium]